MAKCKKKGINTENAAVCCKIARKNNANKKRRRRIIGARK